MRHIAIVILALGAFSSLSIASMEVSKRVQLEEMLERRLTPVVQAADAEAKVYVTLELAEESEPGDLNIPFALQNYVFSGGQSFSKINVLILGRIQELPIATKNLIKKLTKDLGAPVSITLDNLSSLQKTEFSKKESVPIKVQGLDGIRNTFANLSDLLMAMMGLISFLGCVGAILFFKTRGNETEGNKNHAISDSPEILKGYHEESLVAVLSDCYWCEEDAYAAFLWQRIPVEQRKSIVNSTVFLGRYIENVMGLPAFDKTYLNHPYYLNPVSINHLDNKTLTDMVRKHPGLMNRVSPMRRDHLQLSASERIKSELEAGQKAGAPDLMRLPADQERSFQLAHPIPLKSVQEEEEVIKIKGLALEMKARIPTLKWLCDLSAESRAAILDSVSSQELAGAWIGPKGVLDVLKATLPANRRDELQGLLREVKPTRESSGFRKLHSMAIEAMRNEALNNHGQKIKKVA